MGKQDLNGKDDRKSKFQKDAGKDQRRGGRSNRNSRRGRNKGRSDGQDKPSTGNRSTESSSFNDLSWYAQYPELLASSAMLAFPNRPNMDVRLGDFIVNSNTVLHNRKQTVPGIIQIHYDYTFGNSEDVTSPASIAAKQLYSKVRSKFSSNLVADAPDMFMYIIALDQIHAYISWLKRIYKTIGTYSNINFYMPETLFQAVVGYETDQSFNGSYNYEEFVANKVKFWNYINTLVRMTNKFTCPDAFDIMKRHKWMNDRVYSDSMTVAGQLYVFVPRHFGIVDDTGPNGTEIHWIDIDHENLTPENLFAIGKRMIEALSDWEDAYTINGYFMRAFEGYNIFESSLLDQGEQVEIVCVPEVLTQIHNLTVIDTFNQVNISQNPATNAIIYTPRCGALSNSGSIMIDMDTFAPTPAEVTIATRLAAVLGGPASALPTGIYKVICGTEVVTNLVLTCNIPNVDGYDKTDPDGYHSWIEVRNLVFDPTFFMNNYKESLKYLYIMSTWPAFYKAPRLEVICTDTERTSNVWLNQADEGTVLTLGEMFNPAAASVEFMEDLHRVCVYSEFNCFGL